MMALFFLCGFSTVLNTILAPYLQSALNLSYTSIAAVYISFYLAYLIVSPIAGNLLSKGKILQGFRVSLLLSAAGSLFISIGGLDDSYILILLGIFVMASGIACLQVTANPYIVFLGSAETASMRLTFLQGFFALGTVAAPFAGSLLILANLNDLPLAKPYLILSGCWGVAWLLSELFPFPEVKELRDLNDEKSPPVFKDPIVLIGMVMVAIAVGVEISVGNFVIPLLTHEKSFSLSLDAAGQMAMLYWIGFMLGRFFCPLFLKVYPARRVLFWHGFAGLLFGLIAGFGSGAASAYSALALGVCTSILFPVIFTLIMEESRSSKMQISGLLMMANIGGAAIPFLQGIAADLTGIHLSFAVPAACFLAVALFSLRRPVFFRRENCEL